MITTVMYCKRTTFGCVLYLALLAECGFRKIKYIANCHAYMHKYSHIQEYANSNLRQLVKKLISAKYGTRQI